jgi:hypothetical protein
MSFSDREIERITTGIFLRVFSDFISVSTCSPLIFGRLRSRITISGLGADWYLPVLHHPGYPQPAGFPYQYVFGNNIFAPLP